MYWGIYLNIQIIKTWQTMLDSWFTWKYLQFECDLNSVALLVKNYAQKKEIKDGGYYSSEGAGLALEAGG